MVIVQFVQLYRIDVGESKRGRILQAAHALVLKHGLRGTSMEAIARAAGIAKPTLYAYFADKPEIFAALTGELIATWRAECLAALRWEGGVVQRVAAALTARHKAALRLRAASPHAAELFGGADSAAGAPLTAFETELGAAIEWELTAAGATRPRLLAQLLLAASSGIAQRATSPAELGPAIRLLSERMIGPELPQGVRR